MRPPLPLALVPVVLLAAALRPGAAAPATTTPTGATSVPDRHVVVERRAPRGAEPLRGVLVPAGAQDLVLRPESPAASWRVVSVLPHGSRVQPGDLLVRFDAREQELAVEAAELALEEARAALAAEEVREGARRAQAQRRLSAAESAAGRAGEDLEDWNSRGRELEARAAAQARSRQANALADQETELAQLEAMYRADELVEAVEDLVLERSRRDLALSRAAQQLAAEVRARQEQVELARRQQDLERAAVRASAEAGELRGELELEAAAAARRRGSLERGVRDAERRLAAARRDRAACEQTAAHAGWFLHGSLETQRGGNWTPLAVDGRVTPFSPFACLSAGEDLAVALEVQEGLLSGLGGGAPVEVRLPSGGGRVLAGRLTVERFPAGGPGSGRFPGRVNLSEAPIGHVPGHAAEVHLTASGEPELWLPSGALRGVGDARSVLVAQGEGGDYRSVSVRVLAEAGGEVRLEADLADGARVLVLEDGR